MLAQTLISCKGCLYCISWNELLGVWYPMTELRTDARTNGVSKWRVLFSSSRKPSIRSLYSCILWYIILISQNLFRLKRVSWICISFILGSHWFNPLNAELNPIRHLLALVGARHIVHVSRIRVNNIRSCPFQRRCLAVWIFYSDYEFICLFVYFLMVKLKCPKPY